MEKLVDRHVREGVLSEHPLHLNQRDYPAGKTTETALHNVTRIGSAAECKEIALGTFLAVEGDFDITSSDVTTQAAERHVIEPTICRWICSVLDSRNIITTVSGENLRVFKARRCR
jgi:hypothetical protein